MGGKIAYCVAVIFCVIMAYVIMTAYYNPVVTEMANYAANMTDPTAYPEAHAFAGWSSIGLYFVPAIVGIVAIVWKLRQPEQP
jgi:hypothetical protein